MSKAASNNSQLEDLISYLNSTNSKKHNEVLQTISVSILDILRNALDENDITFDMNNSHFHELLKLPKPVGEQVTSLINGHVQELIDSLQEEVGLAIKVLFK